MEKQHQILLPLLASSLFERQEILITDIDWDKLYQEAMSQAVFPLIFTELDLTIPSEKKEEWENRFRYYISVNTNVTYEHSELNDTLAKRNIPYVILKGVASASYYPNPALRVLGDVDFLLAEKDMESATELLTEIGFTAKDEEIQGKHLGFHRRSSVWEMHRSINGVPEGEAQAIVDEYLSDIIETAVDYQTENGTIKIPDTFHHGLVLLLHTASHLTSEGIGLRHLCDWAVFAASLSDDEFRVIFEDKLQRCGLWRFAQILTLVSMRYLHIPKREWAGTVDESLLVGLMEDILSGGNFGFKDNDRYNQIKYISDRGGHTVTKRAPVIQVFHTIRAKAKTQNTSSIRVVSDYLKMVKSGQRKLDSVQTLANAKKRKEIYAEFHLFDKENSQ